MHSWWTKVQILGARYVAHVHMYVVTHVCCYVNTCVSYLKKEVKGLKPLSVVDLYAYVLSPIAP